MIERKISLIILMSVTLLSCSATSLTQTKAEKIANASEQKTAQMSQTAEEKNTSSSSANLGQMLPITAKTEIKGEIIELEVARTPKQQALGLMFRESLPDNRGMLFPFSQPKIPQFWMKNVAISLDMIFLYEGEVKAILAGVPPCYADPCSVYGPDTFIDRVLELRGGRAKELDLKIGDRLEIEFLDITQ